MPNEVRIEAIEHKGRACWQVRLGHRGLRFAQEDLARAFAAQLFARRQWLKEQSGPSAECP
ncbi:hypothetical protein PKB_3129 [Pseudomonas knackmussii B13]|uniref:Uncharacterized protein n=1 Tax=Pseudomonas knackmussii (strain DSM 6978 / CCUG 54928 / LMG 23759 / B13) TaxID=1301098 RepID=A0A024HHV2_PSEKB|nr:hypothetical protein [Pseudomonas knackmussii]CDF84476.1 hypothetical protein PKB_3129 [Pseudomonas knackmussii B13]